MEHEYKANVCEPKGFILNANVKFEEAIKGAKPGKSLLIHTFIPAFSGRGVFFLRLQFCKCSHREKICFLRAVMMFSLKVLQCAKLSNHKEM